MLKTEVWDTGEQHCTRCHAANLRGGGDGLGRWVQYQECRGLRFSKLTRLGCVGANDRASPSDQADGPGFGIIREFVKSTEDRSCGQVARPRGNPYCDGEELRPLTGARRPAPGEYESGQRLVMMMEGRYLDHGLSLRQDRLAHKDLRVLTR